MMLKRILKWTGGIVLLLLLLFSGFIALRQSKTYDAPLPDLHATSDPAMIERGRYLVHGPAHCSGCHNPVENWPRIAAGEEVPLEGGFVFRLPIGEIHTPNLTPDPTGIGSLSDPEIARALRYGVGHDGHPLANFMPFQNLSDGDVIAILSYLRTQPAVKREVPKNHWNLLGKVIYALAIEPVGPEAGKDIPVAITPDTTAHYGEYLANYVANCRGCHTNRDLKTGAYIGEYYAGGFLMPSATQPGMGCVSANLTPDPETGILTNWSREQFIARMRAGRVIPSSEMPWEQFARFTEDDLKAIYAYLRTLPPVPNRIEKVVMEMPS